MLTDKGQKLFKKFNRILAEELGPIYSKLDLIENDHLEEILNKLNWQLELLNQ